MRSIPGTRALKTIAVAESHPLYSNSSVYVVEQKPGLYRRVSRNGAAGGKVGSTVPDAFVAVEDDGSLIELVPWEGAAEDLREAGYGITHGSVRTIRDWPQDAKERLLAALDEPVHEIVARVHRAKGEPADAEECDLPEEEETDLSPLDSLLPQEPEEDLSQI